MSAGPRECLPTLCSLFLPSLCHLFPQWCTTEVHDPRCHNTQAQAHLKAHPCHISPSPNTSGHTCTAQHNCITWSHRPTQQRDYEEERGGQKAASLDTWHVHLQASKIRVLSHSAQSTSALLSCR